MNNFCPEGANIAPGCVTYESFDFTSEEPIFDILLDVLKSQLPARLAKVKGCNGNPLIITEDVIGIIPKFGPGSFELTLNPLGDIPTYSSGLIYREVVYNFELILTTSNKIAECITWELLKFKNVVEGLIVGAEFVIDGYNSVEIEPKGFNYYPPVNDGGIYRRQGSYRFSVTVTQYKN